MQWIKEVGLVDSVDDLKSSSSTRGIQMPNFEVLDAKIASALNRIIHNTQFTRKVSLDEQKAQTEDRFLRGRQIAYLIYEYFWVTGANDSVENYADLFTSVLRNDVVQEFDSKWDGILLSKTKIPPDDILAGLYKLRIRESEKLKTVLELYDLEIHQKAGPDYHRLKTIVKRSIGKIYETGIWGPETEMMKETPLSRIQGQNTVNKDLGDCWQWESQRGSVLKETIAVSVTISISVQNRHSRILLRGLLRGRMREMRREPEVQDSEVPVVEFLDGPSRVTSKELAPIHSVKNGILQNACSASRRMDADLVKSAHSHIVRLVNSLAKGVKNGDKSAVAMLKKNERHQRTG